MPRAFSSLLLSLGIASSGSAVTMDWTAVGDPGNACDLTGAPFCAGSVSYEYKIGTYEVTNAQYAEFLSAVASSDPRELYDPEMAAPVGSYGGITRTGVSGSYAYAAIAGREDMPVNHVTFFDALRFANWMSNGQGNASTETGSYTLLGPGPTPTNVLTLTRNASPAIVVPTVIEWYKAAYYDASSASYFDFPFGSNSLPVCSAPSAAPNTANCNSAAGDLTPRGSYPGSASPYGTLDQGGNVWEWTDTRSGGGGYIIRGGSFLGPDDYLGADIQGASSRPPDDFIHVGFRVAMIPEPSTGLLVIAGLLGLAGWHRAHPNPFQWRRLDASGRALDPRP